MTNNTIAQCKTSFLKGVELITLARTQYNVYSENWTYPRNCYGNWDDNYYAEVWIDGMDYNLTLWIIESIDFSEPDAKPLFIISDDDESYLTVNTLNDIIQMCFRLKRDYHWLKQYDIGRYHDDVLPFLNTTNEECNKNFKVCTFEHASQKKIKFLLSNEICSLITQFRNKFYNGGI